MYVYSLEAELAPGPPVAAFGPAGMAPNREPQDISNCETPEPNSDEGIPRNSLGVPTIHDGLLRNYVGLPTIHDGLLRIT